jgi:uncharacterized protein (DUF1697 family)
MHTYISLLRGINIGGHHLIKMAALKSLYEDHGLKDVTTFLQSGNVLFRSTRTDARALESMLEQSIEKGVGFPVAVAIRTPQQLARTIKNAPYAGKKGIDIDRLAVAFLKSPPTPGCVKALTAAAEKSHDEYSMGSGAIYLHCPQGFAKTLLTSNFFEKYLRVSVTTRNWKTTTALLDLCQKSET